MKYSTVLVAALAAIADATIPIPKGGVPGQPIQESGKGAVFSGMIFQPSLTQPTLQMVILLIFEFQVAPTISLTSRIQATSVVSQQLTMALFPT